MLDIKSFYICSSTIEREREREREWCALKIEYEHARTWGTDVSKPATTRNSLTKMTL
jgi:hypothetical protein